MYDFEWECWHGADVWLSGRIRHRYSIISMDQITAWRTSTPDQWSWMPGTLNSANSLCLQYWMMSMSALVQTAAIAHALVNWCSMMLSSQCAKRLPAVSYNRFHSSRLIPQHSFRVGCVLNFSCHWSDLIIHRNVLFNPSTHAPRLINAWGEATV